MASPRVVVLGGINGAGKTTASTALLNALDIKFFTNADLIARGLNSVNPESVSFEAGRVMLNWMKDLVAARHDFAIETTLAARTYVKWLKFLKEQGYRVYLFYTWLESAEIAVARVKQRVQSGGHHIPETDIRRRYSRSVRNFLDLYMPLADEWEVVDNTNGSRKVIGMGNGSVGEYDLTRWEDFKRSASE